MTSWTKILRVRRLSLLKLFGFNFMNLDGESFIEGLARLQGIEEWVFSSDGQVDGHF